MTDSSTISLEALILNFVELDAQVRHTDVARLRRTLEGMLDALVGAERLTAEEYDAYQALFKDLFAGDAPRQVSVAITPVDHAVQEREGSRILVCDDDLTVEILARAALEQLGFVVLFAESAEQALDIYLDQPVDALVTDVCLPGEDGYWLIEQVIAHRRREGLPRIPMISISGQVAPNEAMSMLMKVGGLFHHEKPADWIELAHWLANACGTPHQRAALH